MTAVLGAVCVVLAAALLLLGGKALDQHATIGAQGSRIACLRADKRTVIGERDAARTIAGNAWAEVDRLADGLRAAEATNVELGHLVRDLAAPVRQDPADVDPLGMPRPTVADRAAGLR